MLAKTIGKVAAALIAAVSIAASGVSVAQATPPVPTPVGSTSACQDVVILGAEGSGQTFADDRGLGPEVWSGLTSYAEHMDGYSLGYFTVPYPSAPADVVALTTAKYRATFFESIDKGVYETLNFLQHRVAHCQSLGQEEHYVLMGYSQGAMVMHRVLWQLTEQSTSYPGLGDKVLPLLDGILAIADGDRVSGQGGVAMDTAADSGYGVWWSGATLVSKPQYKPLYKPISDLGSKWSPAKFHSVCHSKDVVCDTSNLELEGSGNKLINAFLMLKNAATVAAAVKTHGSYRPGGENSVYVRSAATNIAKTSKAANPKTTTGLVEENAQIAMGRGHGLTIGQGGTVWASGRNYRGQLGNGTTIDSAAPVQVAALDNVTGVWASGDTTSLAVRSDGTVWAWGENTGNVFLNGSYQSTTPIQIPGLEDVESLIVSGHAKYARKTDGSVWVWQGAPYGHFDGNAVVGPTQLPGVANVTKVSSNLNWTLALTADGSVWNWGTSYYGFGPRPGQLIGAATPTKLANVRGARDIFTDGNTSYVVQADGTVWSWGYGGFGRLGTGSTDNAVDPVQIPGLSDVHSVFSGPTVVKGDGTAWTWGSNSSGSLGTGMDADSLVPVRVEIDASVRAIFGFESRFAVDSDGALWAWGRNSYGALGLGLDDPLVRTPARVSLPAAVKALSSDGTSVLALTSESGVWGWGANDFGQVGAGSTGRMTTPGQWGGQP